MVFATTAHCVVARVNAFFRLMHHSWYHFWDWIPPGWHHVEAESGGEGFWFWCGVGEGRRKENGGEQFDSHYWPAWGLLLTDKGKPTPKLWMTLPFVQKIILFSLLPLLSVCHLIQSFANFHFSTSLSLSLKLPWHSFTHFPLLT